ncbi:uncharacterized protein LOC110683148 [Chenopodium quinoa]|uniref:uncharacterized protein LOC110683148 n=1 Tax=Chenopodium quinoa TaxID=63459 RepID=UPI000B77BF81|nr:uncharacterized protein LOC110683148 [Chenopodium quinoa]
MVADLIDHESREWKENIISENFNAIDARSILAIPLCSSSPQDSICWAFSMDGTYSVKTAYMLGKSCNLDDFHRTWVDIWKLDVTPKVRHFLWRICTAWPSDLSFLELFEGWNKQSSRKQCKGAILMWNLWRRRNEKIFQGSESFLPVLVDRVQRLANECISASERIYGVARVKQRSSPKTWQAPPDGVIKLNCDASLCTEGWVGLGVVARNSSGEVLLAACRRSRAFWPPIIAECKAVLMAVRLAKRYEFKDIVIESDSQVLVGRLNKGSIFLTDLDGLLEDVFNFCNSFNSTSWSHILKGGQ